jgi:hypothetical protein
MTRRATPQPGVDRMVSTSWSGRRWSSPAARQGRALARGLEGRFPLQHHYVRDQNSSSSRCRAYFSLALKHGIYRDRIPDLRSAGTRPLHRFCRALDLGYDAGWFRRTWLHWLSPSAAHGLIRQSVAPTRSSLSLKASRWNFGHSAWGPNADRRGKLVELPTPRWRSNSEVDSHPSGLWTAKHMRRSFSVLWICHFSQKGQ